MNMTIEGDALPKEMKAAKVAGRMMDEHRETFSCACKKGGSCFRDVHQDGTPCEMIVTLSKTNRHKVCNQCRKNKAKKMNQGSSSSHSSMNERVVPLPVVPSITGPDAYHAIPMALSHPTQMEMTAMPVPHILHESMHSVPVMPHTSRERETQAMVNSNGPFPGKIACQCDKGGSCARGKHYESQSCDRTVSITKNDKHTRCKGCRYLKKKKVGTPGGHILQGQLISQMNAMEVPPVPSASQAHLMPMGGSVSVPSLNAVPFSHLDHQIPHQVHAHHM